MTNYATIKAALIATFLLAGCASSGPITPSDVWLVGYTCCNLTHEQNSDWISDVNYTGLTKIPAGSPIRVAKVGSQNYRVDAEISGKHYRFGQDYGRSAEPFESWLRRMVVVDDPRSRISNWTPEIQRVVRDGKVMIGMTKEQVIISLGYPPKFGTPNINAKTWKYWETSGSVYFLHWEDERVSKISHSHGSPTIIEGLSVSESNSQTANVQPVSSVVTADKIKAESAKSIEILPNKPDALKPIISEKKSSVVKTVSKQMPEIASNKLSEKSNIVVNQGNSNGADLADKMRTLNKLYREGLINQQEFDAKRQELLNRI